MQLCHKSTIIDIKVDSSSVHKKITTIDLYKIFLFYFEYKEYN